ncbi:MAG TPA: TOBE domain-containing protein [Gammaproteobacteria bacterium]|nr:TOBE domain-containing protein [Gammaproteobacteria bacterium]
MVTGNTLDENQFTGTVRHVRRSGEVSEVEVDIGDFGIITSVVETDWVDSLGVRQGSKVLALFGHAAVALAGFGPD